MALKTTDYLLGPSRVSDDIIKGVLDRLDRPDVKDAGFLVALRNWCRVAGVDDANAISQVLWETDNMRAYRWNSQLNPAGIGITSDGTAQPFKIASVDESARLLVQCIYSMVKKQWHPDVPIPDKAKSWMDGIWLNKVRSVHYPKGVDQVHDQNIIYYTPDGDWHATWAADDGYMGHVARGNYFMPNLPDQGVVVTPPKETPVSDLPYAAPRVRIAITPYGNTNRPKLEMASPSYITVHEVGNTSPGADEEMHRRFVHNGGGPANVSFHFVVGPTEVIQLLPLDEAAWHASDGYYGTGNRDSVAIETIQIGDFNKTLWHLAWLINAIKTNPEQFYFNHPRRWDFGDKDPKQHRDWAPDLKNCPQFIRNRGLWGTLLERVKLWKQAGEAPKPSPYASPVTYDWLAKEEADKGLNRAIGKTKVYYLPLVYKAVRETPRRQATGDNHKIIGPPIEAGTTFRADYVYRSHGVTYVLTPYGTRVVARDLLPKVQISLRGTISIRATADAEPVVKPAGA